MKTSSSSPVPIKAIITLETSGEFLLKVAKVMAATGMDLEELFDYLSSSLDHARHDQLPDPLLFNGRLPGQVVREFTETMSDIVDSLRLQTEAIEDKTQTIRIVSINDDDSAFIEIVPLSEIGTTASAIADHDSRPLQPSADNRQRAATRSTDQRRPRRHFKPTPS